MLPAIVCGLVLRQEMPNTFDELMNLTNKAYHELTTYTDTWDFNDHAAPDVTLRCHRIIDGKRSMLRMSMLAGPGDNENPLVFQGANGSETFAVAFRSKSYFRMADDGAIFDGRMGTPAQNGSFSMSVSGYSINIACKPALQLK